jgi:hypothetical protein
MVTDRMKTRDVYSSRDPDSFFNILNNLPSTFLQQNDFHKDVDNFTKRLREIKESNTRSNFYHVEDDPSVNSNNAFSMDTYSQEEEEEKQSDFQSERLTVQQYQSKSQMKNEEGYMCSATGPNQCQQNYEQDCEQIHEGDEKQFLTSNCEKQFDREILDCSITNRSYEIYKSLPPPPPPTCTPPAMKQKQQQSTNKCNHATNANEKLSSSENDGEGKGYFDTEEYSMCDMYKINELPSTDSTEAERREGNNSFEADGPLRGDTCETVTRKVSVLKPQDDSDNLLNITSPPILQERREDNKTSVNSSFRSDQQKMTRIRIASLQIKKSLKKEGTDERLDINNSSLSAKARSYLHGQRLKISVNDEIAEVKKISSSSDSLANRRNPRVLEFMKKKMRSRAD